MLLYHWFKNSFLKAKNSRSKGVSIFSYFCTVHQSGLSSEILCLLHLKGMEKCKGSMFEVRKKTAVPAGLSGLT